MGEAKKRPLRLHFDRRLKLEFHGARVRRAVGPVGSGRCLPRGVAQGRYCLAHDAYASIETVSRDGKGMFGAHAASETAHPSM